MARPGIPIVVENLSKQFGAIRAVDGLSFAVQPGRVTGFLGPNGAGKSTTLRILLGLVAATSGSATFGGQRYSDLRQPLRTVGAGLDAQTAHPGRSALDHLRCYAPLAGARDSRCTELLEMVGLSHAAGRRIGTFSLGMRQRLSLALTLLGDPQVLVLDEPSNGLDPEGMRWLRELLRHLAGRGCTVLVSSHMLGEMQQTVDDVVIIAQGALRYASTLADLAGLATPRVRVVAADAAGLAALARQQQWTVQADAEGTAPPGAATPADLTPPPALELVGVQARQVGAAAFRAGLELHELTEVGPALEDVFLSLISPAAPKAPGVSS